MAIRHTLIALDEDNAVLRQIDEIARGLLFKVVGTRSPQRALNMIHSDASAAVLVTGQMLNNTSGVTVLRAAQKLRPEILRVLTATADELATLIEALHTGAVQQIVYKPIRSAELISAISNPGSIRAIAS